MLTIMPNFEKRDGLIVVIAQDVKTREVLMQAFTDKAGYLETLRTGKAVYYSTSRKRRWVKGEESGNIQTVTGIAIDCDGDAVIYFVEQKGGCACHTGAKSCFFRLSPVGCLIGTDGKDLKLSDKERLATEDVEVHPTLTGGFQ